MFRLVLGIVIPLAIVGFFGIIYGRNTLHDMAQNNARAINALKSQSMLQWLEERKQDVEGIAHSQKMGEVLSIIETPTNTPKQRDEAMSFLSDDLRDVPKKEHASISSISIFDLDTNMTLVRVPVGIGMDQSGNNDLISAAKTKTVVEERYDPVTKANMIVVATPIVIAGMPHAIFFAETELDNFLSIAKNQTGLEAGGESYILDMNGRNIALQKDASESDAGGSSKIATPFVQHLLVEQAANPSGIFETSIGKNANTIVAYNTLSTGWILVTEIPNTQFLSIVNWPLLIILLFVAIILAGFIAIVN